MLPFYINYFFKIYYWRTSHFIVYVLLTDFLDENCSQRRGVLINVRLKIRCDGKSYEYECYNDQRLRTLSTIKSDATNKHYGVNLVFNSLCIFHV